MAATSSIGQALPAIDEVENYLREKHLTGSWHHILNNTTCTRPKSSGGPTFRCLSELKQSTILALGTHTCTICLPCAFETNDGEGFTISATAPSEKKADEAACLRALATLLAKNASKVLLRQTHWHCPVREIVAKILAITGQMRQPLAAQVADEVDQPGSSSQDVVDLLRAILHNEGGIADPSRLRAFKDGTNPNLRLGEMIPRGTLLQFLQARTEEFEVLPNAAGRKGFQFWLRSCSNAAAPTAGVVPGPASMQSGSEVQRYDLRSASPFTTDCAPGSASASFPGQPKSVVAEITKLMRRPRCKHGTLDPNGRPWPQRADKAQSVVEANHIHPDYLDPDVGKCLDATLFRADKRGWDESWQYLLDNRHDFEFIFMNTSGGYRGFEITCVHCDRSCALSWYKQSCEQTLEANRLRFESFLGQASCTSLPSSASKPIV